MEQLPPPQAGDPHIKGMVLHNRQTGAPDPFMLEEDGSFMSSERVATLGQEIQAQYQANKTADQTFQNAEATPQWAPEPEQPRYGYQFSARSAAETNTLKKELWGSDWQGAEAAATTRGVKPTLTDADKDVLWGAEWRRKAHPLPRMADLPEELYSGRSAAQNTVETPKERRSILSRVKNAISLLPAKVMFYERQEGKLSRRRRAAIALGSVGLAATNLR